MCGHHYQLIGGADVLRPWQVNWQSSDR